VRKKVLDHSRFQTEKPRLLILSLDVHSLCYVYVYYSEAHELITARQGSSKLPVLLGMKCAGPKYS